MDKIICVGKNYPEHARELGDPPPEEPIYFFKPPSALMSLDSHAMTVNWPAQGELHHELELVYRIHRARGKWTLSHFTIGLDMTLRDIQSRLKKLGQPWERSKTFSHSALTGKWLPVTDLQSTLEAEFSLSVNGCVRQTGHGSEMTWKPEDLLADLERLFPLCEGDLLFTGTPAGVGPLNDGDVLWLNCGELTHSIRCAR